MVFLIAGESSGDQLGAHLIAALRRAEPHIVVRGIGGTAMAAEGLSSLFPMSDIAVMGFTSVAARLPQLLRRIEETAQAILSDPPSVIVLVDAPDFTHRVARKVRRQNPAIPIIGYVSPSVWAWRSGRARAMRPYVDEIMALLPFEPDAHARLGGPKCTYVGHSLIEDAGALCPRQDDLARREASPPILVVLPGSRGAEVRRLLPIFGSAVERLRSTFRDLEVIIPAVPHLHEEIARSTAAWSVQPTLVLGDDAKRAAFRQARAALAASGTVILELALAGVPTVAAYRVSLIEEAIVRTLIRMPRYTLPNIILEADVVPELLQREANPERLSAAVLPLLLPTSAGAPERSRQLAAFARLKAIMSRDGEPPSAQAARIVLRAARGAGQVRSTSGT